MAEEPKPEKRTYIVDWDIPTERRRMFYYYLNQVKARHGLEGSMSSQSVMMATDEELAREVFALASKYGKASLYLADLIESNNHGLA